MNAIAQPREVEHFRTQIGGRYGLHFDDSKLTWLHEILSRRSVQANRSCAQYLAALDGPAMREECASLLLELTVPETYFFRNGGQLDALRERVLPELAAAGPASVSSVRILCAGCASGEEPYSIAMTLHELLPRFPGGIAIHAVDICPALIEKARRGRFTSWSMRETAAADQQRWFRPEGRDWLIDDAIRRSVSFDVCNLNDEAASLWRARPFDVIFCRNVLMYFSQARASEAIARLTGCLAPNGHIFLGHAETLRGVSQDFDLVHTHQAFYYRHRSAPLAPTDCTSANAIRAQFAAPRVPAHALPGTYWFDSIQTSTDRIRQLAHNAEGGTQAHAWPRAGESAFGRAPSAPTLADALERLLEEMYADALRIVEALPQFEVGETKVRLLQAILLNHDGQTARALEACREIIQRDSMNAEAHYVQALCFENMGDITGASERLQEASHLDPHFAMPRVHLGLVARRMGDRAQARREFEQAIPLVETESAERLLLFGGGYHRRAWLNLCRSELLAGTGTQ
jgi:chemotaxis protein methyltransferase CheR